MIRDKLNQLGETCETLRDELSNLRTDVALRRNELMELRAGAEEQKERIIELATELNAENAIMIQKCCDERDLAISEAKHDFSVLFKGFSSTLTKHTTRLINAEHETRSRDLACMRKEIMAMLEERIAEVIRQERMVRVKEMSGMLSSLRASAEHGLSACRQDSCTSKAVQASRFQGLIWTPSHDSRLHDSEADSEISDRSHEVPKQGHEGLGSHTTTPPQNPGAGGLDMASESLDESFQRQEESRGALTSPPRTWSQHSWACELDAATEVSDESDQIPNESHGTARLFTKTPAQALGARVLETPADFVTEFHKVLEQSHAAGKPHQSWQLECVSHNCDLMDATQETMLQPRKLCQVLVMKVETKAGQPWCESNCGEFPPPMLALANNCQRLMEKLVGEAPDAASAVLDHLLQAKHSYQAASSMQWRHTSIRRVTSRARQPTALEGQAQRLR